jgi:signal transduction histidine kinase
VDPGAVIRSVHDLYEPMAEEKALAFTATVDGAGSLWGDYDLLVDMVSNLVDNAIKFTPPGGTVDVAVLRDARDNVVIRVSDSGPGIAKEERVAVFQRFYRSEHSGQIQGHGLGLSLVRAIAELHGFEIGVEDGGPGAVFNVAMRADAAQAGAQHVP